MIKDFWYRHRNFDIHKIDGDITIESAWSGYRDYTFYLFKTFSDARQYIDMICDSTNTRKPRVVGMWRESDNEIYTPLYWEMIQSCKKDGCEYLGEGDMDYITALNKYGNAVRLR